MTLELPVIAPPKLFADGSMSEQNAAAAPSTVSVSNNRQQSTTVTPSSSGDSVFVSESRMLRNGSSDEREGGSVNILNLLNDVQAADVIDRWIAENADVAVVERIQAAVDARLRNTKPRSSNKSENNNCFHIVNDDDDDDGGDVVPDIPPPRSRRSSNNSSCGNNQELQTLAVVAAPHQQHGYQQRKESSESDCQTLRPSAAASRYDIYRSSFRGRNSLTSTLFRNWVTNPAKAKAQPGKLRVSIFLTFIVRARSRDGDTILSILRIIHSRYIFHISF